MALVDLTGKKFARLSVLARSENPIVWGNQKKVAWLCLCECGQQTTVTGQSLRAGRAKSCGCLKKDNTSGTTHGKSHWPEHPIWMGMLARCFNPNRENYPLYGGRGITVCDRWRFGDNTKSGFEYFIEDVGRRPSKLHSLERAETDGNYEPGNVTWATNEEQATNKRNTRWVTYRGERMALTAAVRRAGSVIHYEAAAVRLRSGWTVERALETPSSKIARTA